jgi:hypothetical protein
MPIKEIIIHNIFTSPEHNYFTRDRFEVGNAPTFEHLSMEFFVGKGLEGDRFEFSKYPITFFSLEVAQEVCSSLDIELDIKLFRRNIIVSGVHLNSLIGKRFKIGNIEFEGLDHCAPCVWMNAVMKKGAYASMRGRGGIRVKIIEQGRLSCGSFELSCESCIDENPLKPLKRIKLPS